MPSRRAPLRALPGTLLVAGAAALAPASAAGQEPRELGVAESVRLGLERSPRLRAAAADAAAAGASSRVARSAMLPALVAQGSYTRLSDNIPGVEFTLPGLDTTFTFQGVELNRYHGELSVAQPLFTGGRLRSLTRAAEYDAAAAELGAAQERAEVAAEIRQAYWELQRARAVQATMASALAQVDEHVRDVRTRLAEGAALRRDLLVAQTRRSEVQLEQVEADNAVRLAQLELNRLMGLPLDAEVVPADVPALAEAEPQLAALTAAALEERPELGALALQLRGVEARIAAARGQRLPQLDLTGRYLYSRPNPYFFMEQDRFRPTWELVIGGRWSLWEGGRVAAQTGEARARREAAGARLADAREQVAVAVARAHLEVLRARAAAAAAALHVSEAEETYRVVRQQFAEGAALSVDVLEAEQTQRRAQARRAQALADYEIARAGVHRVLGRVW